MSSWQSRLIRPLLWGQKLAQNHATIEPTRRMSVWTERFYSMLKDMHQEKFPQGEHSFIIEPISNNMVRFVDRELFNGLLVPLQAKDIDTNSKRGFAEMDKALKTRVESNQ